MNDSKDEISNLTLNTTVGEAIAEVFHTLGVEGAMDDYNFRIIEDDPKDPATKLLKPIDKSVKITRNM